MLVAGAVVVAGGGCVADVPSDRSTGVLNDARSRSRTEDDPLWGLSVALASLAACDEQEPLKPTCARRRQPRPGGVETRCDGIDNDCDGLTDVLPVDEANACASDSCQPGQFACIGSERTCLVPALADETVDGIDNDCDGQTDEPSSAAALPALARVAVPPYLWQEGDTPVRMMQSVFDWVGLPYDLKRPKPGQEQAQWDALFDELANYRLVVMPGYINPTFITESQRDKLGVADLRRRAAVAGPRPGEQ